MSRNYNIKRPFVLLILRTIRASQPLSEYYNDSPSAVIFQEGKTNQTRKNVFDFQNEN